MITAKVTATVTRPADTTQYAVGEVVSTAAGARLTFEGLPARIGEGCLIESSLCISSAAQVTKPDLELWLFDTDIALDADNAAFTPTDAEMLTLVGIIPFAVANFVTGDATSGAGGNVVCILRNTGIVTTANKLYGALIVRNTYTPVSAEIFTVVLNVVR